MKAFSKMVFVGFSLLGLSACSVETGEGSSTGATTKSSPSSTSACSGYLVRDGDYRCAGGKIGGLTIEVCKDGEWQVADTCSCSVSVGDPRKPPYSTSCSLGSAKGGTVC